MYTILDIETTGGKFNEEGITEIAIHKFDGHEVVDTFISLINPEKSIQPFVVQLTGINDKMLRTAPKFHEVAKRIVEITTDTVIVAHNAKFDYRILRTEFRRLGYNFERKTLCTVDLSKLLLPDAESYSLGKLVRSLGIPVSDRHRANGDALATIQLFKLLLAKDTEKTIIKNGIRKETHGELSEKQLDIIASVPNEVGVFYVHDKDGEIIYLSHSTDIKKKVNQLFTKSGDRARKLAKNAKKVSFEKTGSELIALLKGHTELVKNRPRYNAIPKKRMFSHTFKIIPNKAGYYQLSIATIGNSKIRNGIFNGVYSAKAHLIKITKEFQLCEVLNNLNENAAPCTKTENSDSCKLCAQGASPELYNTAVSEALATYNLKDKDVLLIDKGRVLDEKSIILIKNGSLVGIGYYTLNHQIRTRAILEKLITPVNGTENANYIIESYLRKKRILKTIPLATLN